MVDFDMKGKVVLITGGSRGLGKAMSLGFAEQGANIAIVSRKLCLLGAQQLQHRNCVAEQLLLPLVAVVDLQQHHDALNLLYQPADGGQIGQQLVLRRRLGRGKDHVEKADDLDEDLVAKRKHLKKRSKMIQCDEIFQQPGPRRVQGESVEERHTRLNHGFGHFVAQDVLCGGLEDVLEEKVGLGVPVDFFFDLEAAQINYFEAQADDGNVCAVAAPSEARFCAILTKQESKSEL